MNAIQRRFEEFNTFVNLRSVAEFLLMLKLGRKTLPW